MCVTSTLIFSCCQRWHLICAAPLPFVLLVSCSDFCQGFFKKKSGCYARVLKNTFAILQFSRNYNARAGCNIVRRFFWNCAKAGVLLNSVNIHKERFIRELWYVGKCGTTFSFTSTIVVPTVLSFYSSDLCAKFQVVTRYMMTTAIKSEKKIRWSDIACYVEFYSVIDSHCFLGIL